MVARRIGRLLGIGTLALLLAGCFKVNMDVEISPDNMVSGSAIVAVDQSILELSGQSVDQLFADMDISDLPEGAAVEAYEDGGFVGQEIIFDGVSLEEFQGSQTFSGSGEELSIERRGDEFHVSGRLDMSGEEFTGGGQIPQQLLESFEFRISITFPGEVRSATGEIDGNKVTWEPTFGQDNPIQAVASAIPSESSPLLLILLIVVGAFVLGAVAFLLMRGRSPAPATVPLSEGAGPIEGGTTSAQPGAPAVTEPPPPLAAPPSPVPPTEPAPPAPEAPGSAVPPEDQEPPPVPPVSG